MLVACWIAVLVTRWTEKPVPLGDELPTRELADEAHDNATLLRTLRCHLMRCCKRKITRAAETKTQSDFEKLEIRLQVLEDQIKNQQRDLHTLLQKLRGIAAKSQSAAEPKKSKGGKNALFGAILCVMAFGAVYYWLGAEVITSSLYQVTGFMMALIDKLAGKI